MIGIMVQYLKAGLLQRACEHLEVEEANRQDAVPVLDQAVEFLGADRILAVGGLRRQAGFDVAVCPGRGVRCEENGPGIF